MVIEELLHNLQQLLQQKQQLMQQVLSVSEQLVDADGELEKIQTLLDARQEYMHKIDQLDQQIELIKQGISSAAGVSNWSDVERLYPQMAANMKAQVGKINELAAGAHRLSEQSRQQAESRLLQLQQEFKKLQHNKTGFTAYRSKGVQSSGYFLDEKK